MGLIGREGTAVRVQIDGGESIVVDPGGREIVNPPRPGTVTFKFTAVDSGESFERDYDIPKNDLSGGPVLAIPTQEDTCFVALDVTAWYGRGQSLFEIASDRAEGKRPRAGSTLPDPKVVSRIRPLDPLPAHYGQNWNLPTLAGEREDVITLVDVPCNRLSASDRGLAGDFVARDPQLRSHPM